MKRWVLLTVALYAVMLFFLAAPVVYWTAGDWNFGERQWWTFSADTIDMGEVYRLWAFWIWLGIMALGQFLLLLVPMDVARGRPVSRRKLLVPVVTSAFFFANLVFAGLFCLLFTQFGDEALDKVLFWTNFGLPESVADSLQAQTSKFMGINLDESTRTMLGAVGILLLLWTIWAYVFYRLARPGDPQGSTRKLNQWLLKGSILEFLIAVPSHIIVRGRNDCCAPAGTFWGIVTGLSIMLICFGPSVFFLFVARFHRLRPKTIPPSESD